MGWRRTGGPHAVDGDFSAYVATEMKNDAAVLKEARKAREEAAQRRQNPKKGGGSEAK